MKLKLLMMLMDAVLRNLSGDDLKGLADKLIDTVEDKVKGSETQVDDIIVLPLCKLARSAFAIPDNDEPEHKD